MRCNRCGNELSEGARFCEKCGEKIEEMSSNMTNVVIPSPANTPAVKTADRITKACGVLFTLGGFFTLAGGLEMQDIKSVSGHSVAEAFYNAFGTFALGMSFCMIGVGLYMLFKKK